VFANQNFHLKGEGRYDSQMVGEMQYVDFEGSVIRMDHKPKHMSD